MLVVKKVGAEAIPVIKNIADLTWPNTYKELISAEQLSYMMELIYSTTSLQNQIQQGQRFIVVYDDDDAVAFASYSAKENSQSIFKLHKIYILPNQQGKGIGSTIINFITNDIAPAAALQLNVNRQNKAISFYQKIGFRIIAEEDIDIGNGFFMNDYIMEMQLQ